jgi:hypothetical protein
MFAYITTNVKRIAHEVLGTNNKKAPKNNWWTEEVQHEVQEKKPTCHRWMNSNREEDR